MATLFFNLALLVMKLSFFLEATLSTVHQSPGVPCLWGVVGVGLGWHLVAEGGCGCYRMGFSVASRMGVRGHDLLSEAVSK